MRDPRLTVPLLMLFACGGLKNTTSDGGPGRSTGGPTVSSTAPANGASATVDYGPLSFSLDIPTLSEHIDSARTALRGAAWQAGVRPADWPATILRPAAPWNYALVLPGGPVGDALSVEWRPWPADNFPFTPGSSPLVIRARARRAPEWTLDQYGLASPVPKSPVATSGPTQEVTLIPMGAARLRISAFPVSVDR